MKRILILAAALLIGTVAASGQIRQRGGMPDASGMGMMQPVVAPDGTLLVAKVEQGQKGVLNHDVVALSPGGTTVWSWRAPGVVHDITVSGNLVVVSGWAASTGRPMVAAQSELTALSLSNGAQAWKLALDGMAMSITPAGTQMYAIVSKGRTSPQPGGGMGGGMMQPPSMSYLARSLVAISNSGTILWTTELGN